LGGRVEGRAAMSGVGFMRPPTVGGPWGTWGQHDLIDRDVMLKSSRFR
jgi:hypothetical protein